MKLISMTSFILNFKGNTAISHKAFEFARKVKNYAEFLKQPLTLGIFFPADQNGNILSEPQMIEKRLGFDEVEMDYDYAEVEVYKKAKERVLFKGFSIREEKRKKFVGVEGYEIEVSLLPKIKMTIEDLANDWNHIELTESALKQIGLNP